MIVMVIDVLDINGSFISNIRQIVGKCPIFILATKVDLLPKGTDLEKVRDWLRDIIFRKQLTVIDVFLVSSKTDYQIRETISKIMLERNGRNIYVIGSANVGKSKFVRALLNDLRRFDSKNYDPGAVAHGRFLPIESAMPGTTLGVIPLSVFSSGGILYDTPGVHTHHRLLHSLSINDLKLLNPTRKINTYYPTAPIDVMIYQAKENYMYQKAKQRLDQQLKEYQKQRQQTQENQNQQTQQVHSQQITYNNQQEDDQTLNEQYSNSIKELGQQDNVQHIKQSDEEGSKGQMDTTKPDQVVNQKGLQANDDNLIIGMGEPREFDKDEMDQQDESVDEDGQGDSGKDQDEKEEGSDKVKIEGEDWFEENEYYDPDGEEDGYGEGVEDMYGQGEEDGYGEGEQDGEEDEDEDWDQDEEEEGYDQSEVEEENDWFEENEYYNPEGEEDGYGEGEEDGYGEGEDEDEEYDEDEDEDIEFNEGEDEDEEEDEGEDEDYDEDEGEEGDLDQFGQKWNQNDLDDFQKLIQKGSKIYKDVESRDDYDIKKQRKQSAAIKNLGEDTNERKFQSDMEFQQKLQQSLKQMQQLDQKKQKQQDQNTIQTDNQLLNELMQLKQQNLELQQQVNQLKGGTANANEKNKLNDQVLNDSISDLDNDEADSDEESYYDNDDNFDDDMDYDSDEDDIDEQEIDDLIKTIEVESDPNYKDQIDKNVDSNKSNNKQHSKDSLNGEESISLLQNQNGEGKDFKLDDKYNYKEFQDFHEEYQQAVKNPNFITIQLEDQELKAKKKQKKINEALSPDASVDNQKSIDSSTSQQLQKNSFNDMLQKMKEISKQPPSRISQQGQQQAETVQKQKDEISLNSHDYLKDKDLDIDLSYSSKQDKDALKQFRTKKPKASLQQSYKQSKNGKNKQSSNDLDPDDLDENEGEYEDEDENELESEFEEDEQQAYELEQVYDQIPYGQCTYLIGGIARLDILESPKDIQFSYHGPNTLRILAMPFQQEQITQSEIAKYIQIVDESSDDEEDADIDWNELSLNQEMQHNRIRQSIGLGPAQNLSPTEESNLVKNALIGYDTVQQNGGLIKVEKEFQIPCPGKSGVLTDIQISGFPGWVTAHSLGRKGMIRIRAWLPAGVLLYLRQSMPIQHKQDEDALDYQ